MNKTSRNNLRKIRKRRSVIKGIKEIPRFCVFRSNKRIYIQLIDDKKGVTLAGVLSEISGKDKNKSQAAFNAGQQIAKIALDKLKVKRAIFDRGGYKFHGRVKSVLEGAQEAGLNFKKK